MVIHQIPIPHEYHFSENWFYRALRVLSISFVGFQFLEDGEDYSPFYMKDSDNKTMSDYFNTEHDSTKSRRSWFDSVSEYITDMVDWSSDEDERVAIKSIVKEEFFNYYQRIVNSDIINLEGTTLHGLPPNKNGITSSTVIILLHIFFKTEIKYVQNHIY